MRVLLVGFFIAVLDQLTKSLVRREFMWGESRSVIDGFFHLTYVRNPGAAWGMLDQHGVWLTIFSMIMLVLIVVYRRRFLSDTWEHRLALGLMVGGIVGNLLDRLRFGYVIDFLDFHWRGHHWPAFNVADSAICTGVGIYIISSLWIGDHPLQDPEKKAGGDIQQRTGAKPDAHH